MSSSHETLNALATSFLAAFTHLDAAAHIALRSPACKHVFLPSSYGIPTLTNGQYGPYLSSLQDAIATWPVTAREIHTNPIGGMNGTGHIVIWATGKPEFVAAMRSDGDGETDWEYVGEYIILLDVDREGRIERVVEFVDSKGSDRLKGLIERARANIGGWEGEKGEEKIWV